MCTSSFRCLFAFVAAAALIALATLSIPQLAEGPAAVGICPMIYVDNAC